MSDKIISLTTDFPGVDTPDNIVITDDMVTTISVDITMEDLRLLIDDDVQEEVDSSVQWVFDNLGETIPEAKIKLFLLKTHNDKLDKEAKDLYWHNNIIDAFERLRVGLTDNRTKKLKVV